MPSRALVPARPEPPRNPAREEMLRGIRLRLVDETIGAFDPKLDVKNAADVRAKIEGIVDRVIGVHEFAVTRDERLRLVEEMIDEVTGLGPLEPLLLDDSITEVMVNGPRSRLHRAGRQDRPRRRHVPEQRARPADHRPDHHARSGAASTSRARGSTPASRTAHG